jgi:carbonic anhydrase
MQKSFNKIIKGYQKFREKYASKDNDFLLKLAENGQRPEIMVISCCDSRVDPALLLQCDPGDLFVVRNVANIVPPYEKDEAHHGTSAALEFGICHLNIKHLIILGHSHCAGVQVLVNKEKLVQDDFISNWVNLIKSKDGCTDDVSQCAKDSLISSYKNCLTFPWIEKRLESKSLLIHLWFFEIKEGLIHAYNPEDKTFKPVTLNEPMNQTNLTS